MNALACSVLGVQCAQVQPLPVGDRVVRSGFAKTGVAGDVAVGLLGLEDDEQADLSVHGGLEKAVYAYPAAHYAFWQAQLVRGRGTDQNATLAFGALGENLTVAGLLESTVWVGDIWRLPHCALRVTVPRQPCYKLNAALGWHGAARAMVQAGCCGFYLAVHEPGRLRAGDPITVESGPRQVSLAQAFAAKVGRRAPDHWD